MNKVVFEEEGWSVYETKYWSGGKVYSHVLLHTCKKRNKEDPSYTTYRHSPYSVGRPCEVCTSSASEAVQTVYLLVRREL